MVTSPTRQNPRLLPGWTRLIEPVLTMIEAQPGIGFAELQRRLGTTVGILGRALEELRLRELVILRGLRRDARYYLGGPPVRLAGPLPVTVTPPLTAAERAWTEQRLACLHGSGNQRLRPSAERKLLDALERDFRRVQPTVAANDPLAGMLVEAIHKAGVLRRFYFGPRA